jgi:hypothetical protein
MMKRVEGVEKVEGVEEVILNHRMAAISRRN